MVRPTADRGRAESADNARCESKDASSWPPLGDLAPAPTAPRRDNGPRCESPWQPAPAAASAFSTLILVIPRARRTPTFFCRNSLFFSRNIFALRTVSGIINTIGANRSRLHGFHRFLPHLWELFLCPHVRGHFATFPWPFLLRPPCLRQRCCRWPSLPRFADSTPSPAEIVPVRAFFACQTHPAAGRTTGITPNFATLYRSYSTDTDGPSDTTHTAEPVGLHVAPPPCPLPPRKAPVGVL